MKFKKLRIIEAGLTANSAPKWDGSYLPLYITEEAVQSVVTLGNMRPIHCRRTHNGDDMLDGYIGSFSNFVYENGVAYADLELSTALEVAYPQEAKFIETMIEKETTMLGVSIMGANELVENTENNRFDIPRFTELYSCDLVGIPAATSSLFNTNQKEKKMNKFFSAFAEMFKPAEATKLATEVVKTREGGEITIEAAGEEMAIGDKVFDSEGNAVPDGEVIIVTEDGEAILVVEGGAIKEVKPVEPEEEKKVEDTVEETTAAVPEEFSQRLDALETALAAQTAAINDMVAKFSKATKQPITATPGIPKKNETKLSKEAVNAAAKKYL
nr:MAG: prohead core protein serine protease [Bacteriophage sp.]